MTKLEKEDIVTGKLRTRENNYMSLSCVGEMEIKNNIIQSIHSHGMPRAKGEDTWFKYYTDKEVGTFISPLTVQNILDYNGKNNIISVLTSEKIIKANEINKIHSLINAPQEQKNYLQSTLMNSPICWKDGKFKFDREPCNKDCYTCMYDTFGILIN